MALRIRSFLLNPHLKPFPPFRAMISYIWPKDDPGVRRRVKLAVGLLVAAKLLNISVPFIFKHAVDYLNQGGGGTIRGPRLGMSQCSGTMEKSNIVWNGLRMSKITQHFFSHLTC